MDFLRNHAHLAGGDTRKTPNLANHGIRQEGKTPPHANPSQSTKSRNITPNLRTARPPPTPTPLNPPNHGVPSQSFLIQIPIGPRCVEPSRLYCTGSEQKQHIS